MSNPLIHPLLLAAQAHHAAGRLPEAEGLYRQVLEQEPYNDDALHLLGVLANTVQHHEAAKELILRAIAINPRQPRYYSNLGEVYRPMKNYPAALEAYHHAIALNPNYYSAYANLAIALFELARYEEAEKVCRQAIAIDPTMPHAWHTLGNIYKEQRRFEPALEAYQTAIARDPNSAKTYHNLGLLYRYHCKLPEALQTYEAALKLDPNFADVRLNYAIALLLSGQLQRGWQEYEWRWKCRELPSPIRNFAQPLWTGQDIVGKVILLHAEQGFGDAIQFARYISLVALRHPRQILVECHAELERLFQCIPNITLFPRESFLPSFDIHCPFMTLPLAFNTTLENIPNAVPYLSAPQDRITYFKNLLAQDSSSLGTRVGIVWAGRSTHGEDRYRSLPLTMLAPLMQIPSLSFVSLQKGPTTNQVAPSGLSILDLSEHIHDFADTAALIANLDLVITVDTSVAHLSGALAKPTWLLLHNAPDWRWMLNRPDSPWYPTMKIFRQTAFNSWPPVIEQVAAELRAFATSNAQRPTPSENDQR